MNFLCLCPTYGRTKLVANAIALFEAQEYPKDQCKLLVLDDAGQYGPSEGENWSVVSVPNRLDSMPRKYEAMMDLELAAFDCRWDAIVMWDDDEIYLPNHLKNHAETLKDRKWSYPKKVYCCYDPIKVEEANGNMWASIAVRVDYLRTFDWRWWFEMKDDHFDLAFLQRLGSMAEPGRHEDISFMFRWGSTKTPHLQNFCTGKGEAYQNFPQADKTYVSKVVPEFDNETEKILLKYLMRQLPEQRPLA